MNAPTWLQPGITGAIIGGIATMVIGFSAGGWYLGSTAETMAATRSEVAVIDALVPVCISKQQVDPEATGMLAKLGTMKTTYEQRDYIMKAGWATMPATDAPNRDLAMACAEALSKAAGS
ncbi:hypothetical protein [Dongia sp.]|uniref:hypothetical protein n=1 Tax=Dongia sp. TaxID=1977262 RepID=UPI0035B133BF